MRKRPARHRRRPSKKAGRLKISRLLLGLKSHSRRLLKAWFRRAMWPRRLRRLLAALVDLAVRLAARPVVPGLLLLAPLKLQALRARVQALRVVRVLRVFRRVRGKLSRRRMSIRRLTCSMHF